MDDVKIDASIKDIPLLLEKLCKDLESVKSKTQALDVGSWQGASADAFVDLTSLTVQYHDDVLFLVESLRHHIGRLANDINEFPAISEQMRKLDSTI
jgi:uncharacterized protein YukE